MRESWIGVASGCHVVNISLSLSHTNLLSPLSPLDPDITVQITDGGAHQIAGLSCSYILACTIILRYLLN